LTPLLAPAIFMLNGLHAACYMLLGLPLSGRSCSLASKHMQHVMHGGNALMEVAVYVTGSGHRCPLPVPVPVGGPRVRRSRGLQLIFRSGCCSCTLHDV
jgi:hypothetical protein